MAATPQDSVSGAAADAPDPALAVAAPTTRPPASFTTLPDETKGWILVLADVDEAMLRDVGGSCRAWYTVCRPLRWKAMDLKESGLKKLVSFVQHILPLHGPHIRSLVYDAAASPADFRTPAQEKRATLQAIEMITGSEVGEDQDSRQLRARALLVAEIVLASPNLQEVQLYESGAVVGLDDKSRVGWALYPILEVLPVVVANLRILKLDISPGSAPVVAKFIESAVQLEELRLRTTWMLQLESTPAHSLLRSISSLRHLRVLDVDFPVPDNVGASPFTSAVEHFTAKHFRWEGQLFSSLLSFLHHFAPTVRTLKLHSKFKATPPPALHGNAGGPPFFPPRPRPLPRPSLGGSLTPSTPRSPFSTVGHPATTAPVPSFRPLASTLADSADPLPPFLPSLTSLSLDLDPPDGREYPFRREEWHERDARIKLERKEVHAFLRAFCASPLTHITLRNFPIRNEGHSIDDLQILHAFLAHHQRRALQSVRIEIDDMVFWPVPQDVKQWCEQSGIECTLADSRSPKRTGYER
ncbi:hypothetical protein JCM10213_001336 [Rhodosporidiobolus nylandii]